MQKTLKDVAKKAGVSIVVARRALGSYGYVSQENTAKVVMKGEKEEKDLFMKR
jgi:DNA-binding LacI/PurR family transcriptional regulator